jgi:hypothetical protein
MIWEDGHFPLFFLVPDHKSFRINFGVKAAEIDDRKSARIA